ncbi:MAG: hypothetical protein Q8O32_03495 [bacterium]|nr:hypothetical protein [bacterium]
MPQFKKENYLLDYIDGLKNLKTSFAFPIGTVITEEKNRLEILKLLKDQDLQILEAEEKNIEEVIKHLFYFLENKINFAINIKNSIPTLLNIFIKDLANGRVEIVFSDASRKVVENIEPGFFGVLVLNSDLYQRLDLENINSSFCNLIN